MYVSCLNSHTKCQFSHFCCLTLAFLPFPSLLSSFVVVSAETPCPVPTIHYRLKRWYKSQSQQETIQIWKNNTIDGFMVYNFNGKSLENEFIEYTLCLEAGEHVLVAIDRYVFYSFMTTLNSSNDGWSYSSYFELATQGGFTILKGTLEEYSRKEFRFLCMNSSLTDHQ